MTRSLAAILLVLVVAAPAQAAPKPPPSGEQDLVTGSYAFTPPFGGDETRFGFTARSGPSGEAPSGDFAFTFGVPASPRIEIRGDVGCLRVSGDDAVIGVAGSYRSTHPVLGERNGNGAIVVVHDSAANPAEFSQDALAFHPLSEAPDADDCPAASELPSIIGCCDDFWGQYLRMWFVPGQNGDITIRDALPLPTSPAQCKNGGFAAYGFDSQGHCVSFVQRRGGPGGAS